MFRCSESAPGQPYGRQLGDECTPTGERHKCGINSGTHAFLSLVDPVGQVAERYVLTQRLRSNPAGLRALGYWVRWRRSSRGLDAMF